MTTMLILGAAFALVGVPFIWIARRAMARDGRVAHWPRADGVVTSATLHTSTQRYTEKTGLAYDRTMYTPWVCYTYSVNGQRFEGTGISRSIDGILTSRASAQALIDKYVPEKQVSVFYDAADPKVSYLEVGDRVGAMIVLIFGCFWIAVGTLLLVLAIVV
jgi:hypothetical protein